MLLIAFNLFVIQALYDDAPETRLVIRVSFSKTTMVPEHPAPQ
jgi:hypothetical protein